MVMSKSNRSTYNHLTSKGTREKYYKYGEYKVQSIIFCNVMWWEISIFTTAKKSKVYIWRYSSIQSSDWFEPYMSRCAPILRILLLSPIWKHPRAPSVPTTECRHRVLSHTSYLVRLSYTLTKVML